jgi:hypothetical protein
MGRARKTADHVFACPPTGAATPADKDIVTPHDDTPYPWAWLDLRAEPMVLTLPAVPAPKGPFVFVARFHGPRQPSMDGIWKLPPLVERPWQALSCRPYDRVTTTPANWEFK